MGHQEPVLHCNITYQTHIWRIFKGLEAADIPTISKAWNNSMPFARLIGDFKGLELFQVLESYQLVFIC
jgi:hypothetical protein